MLTFEEEREELLTSAKGIIEKCRAANREPTSSETKSLNTKLEEIKSLNERINLSEQGKAAMRSFGDVSGGGDETHGFIDWEAAGRKALAGRLASKMTSTSTFGTKALITAGTAVSDIPLLPSDPISLGKLPMSLLSVIPVIKAPAGANQVAYLQQGTRTNLAAPVAVGALKPTSSYALTRKTALLQVIAHLSEANRFDLEDFDSLKQFVSLEMVYGLLLAIEKEFLVGSGTAPSLTGLTTTSGIQAVPAGVDLLTTLRQAITLIETAGYGNQLVFVLSPATWEELELTRNTSGAFDLQQGPVDRAAGRVWGVPLVISTQLPAGKAVLFSQSSVAAYVDAQGTRTDWGTPGDNFSRNIVTARSELRTALAILQPAAVGLITLPV